MGKKLLLNFSLFIGLLTTTAFILAEGPVDFLLSALQNNTERFPQEKVHLQLDRVHYTQGDEVWLKAYVVNAARNEPTSLSKVLYIDFIDPYKTIKERLTLPIKDGKADGNFTIPDLLPSGIYRVRAYTTYMRNFDDAFFFEKDILIGNTEVIQKSNPSGPIDLQFFPEGGTLINGTESVIGFKAIGEDGLGKEVEGYILDDKAQKVAVFATEHLGMGAFTLKPLPGKTYTAVLIKSDGTKASYKFPAAENTGCTLAVTGLNDAENMDVRITATDIFQKGMLKLIVQSNGIPYYGEAFNVEGTLHIAIAKNKFPTGILQFTLFSSKNVPLAERLIFNNRNDQLMINAAATPVANKQTSIALSVENPVTPMQKGNFSVSVTNAAKDVTDEDDEVTILSNLLLTSDLKGNVEKPNYYFTSNDPDKEQNLDNLMLTQGWRRFSWPEIIASMPPEKPGTDKPLVYMPQQAMEVRGTVKSLSKKSAASVKVTLTSLTSGYVLALDTLTDAAGRFVFDGLDIPPAVSLIVQARGKKNESDFIIELDRGPGISDRQLRIDENNRQVVLPVNNAKEQAPDQKASGIDIKAVTVKADKILAPIVNVPHSKNRNGSADYVVTQDRLVGIKGDMLQMFYRVPGVQIINDKVYRVRANTVSLTKNAGGKPDPVQILIDGIRIDQKDLQTMPASDVEGIEVLVSNYNTAIYEDGYWGVVLITTKMGGSVNEKNTLNKNIAKISNLAFTPVKEFYTPAFSAVQETNPSTAPALVFWAPNVNTGKDGKASIVFDNPVPGNYRVVIEGMDAAGNIGRQVTWYKVP